MIKTQGKTLLIVDDEMLIAESEKIDLERYGYEVITAHSGESSVEIFRNNDAIDLVLMDIDLGKGMDGTEAASVMIKEREIPVVFLSSHMEPEIVEKTESITSYGYVVKHSGITVLDASIKMAFRLFEANRKVKKELAERMRMEQALRESELKYRTLFKSMGQGFYLADILYDHDGEPSDYRFIDINSAFLEIVGLKREELIGRTYNELVPPDPESGWLDCFKRVAETGVPENYTFASAIYNSYFETYAFRPEEGKFAALVKDVTDRVQAEDRIKALLAEKELILKEVHHRIKNNMSVIHSLLKLHSERQSDAVSKRVLHDVAARLQGMIVLYDKLYRSERIASLSVKEYLPALIQGVVDLFPNGDSVRVEARIEDIDLDVKPLFSVGLMISELVINAMKFAFRGRDRGTIRVSACTRDGRVGIELEDDGIGMPDSFTFEDSHGFGMQLVGMLAKQIKASISISRENGTRFTIEFAQKN